MRYTFHRTLANICPDRYKRQPTMKTTPHAAIRSLFAALVVAMLTTPARADVGDGQWLIDYGRAHGMAATNPQPADAEFILVWLDAATELSPELWDAYRWRSDLLSRLNREDDAIENRKHYCAKKPDDAPALVTLFNTQLADLQKIEERIDLCSAFLNRPNIPADAASEIQLHLATLHEGQGDHESALTYARKAIEIAPHNLSAHIFLSKLEDRASAPETQVELLLRAISIDPNSPQHPWQLASYLKQLGLHDEALAWLQIASETWSRATGNQPPPPALLTEIAQIRLKKGDLAESIATAQQVLNVDPQYAPASFVIIRAARKLGRTELADSESSKLTNRFREWETNTHRADAITCFTIAQFFLNVQPDAQRAVRYAELAVQKDPTNLAYREALGQAYVAANLNAEAIQTFATVAKLDAESARAMARAQQNLGDQSAAIESLTSAARQPSEYHDEIKLALEALNATVPPAADLSPTKARLSAFDNFPLTFAADPTQFIEFDVRLSSNINKFGEPLTATLTLKNKGNQSIVLGGNRMLNPQATVSLITDSSLDPYLENFLTIDIPGEAILKPGETRSIEQPLSQADGRIYLTAQPQRRMDLKARFILDPVISESGTVVSRYRNIQPLDVDFMRTPVDASEDGLAKLRKQLVATDEMQRLIATEAFVALIFERFDSMQNKTFTYHALPVDINELATDALTTLRDPNPFVCARSLATLTRLPLNPNTIQAATPLISHPHWLVRLLAVEYFAKKQGPVFLPVLERLAADPHPIVARLATLYRDQAQALRRTRRP
jgi:tetratricopeptide (TPR) repeat protein